VLGNVRILEGRRFIYSFALQQHYVHTHIQKIY
jgi:hypothetical protein